MVLLLCGLNVAAEEPTAEAEECLVGAELGPRDREAALPLAMATVVAVVLVLIAGKAGLVVSLLADTPRELPS